jgi:hypothetical protein
MNDQPYDYRAKGIADFAAGKKDLGLFALTEAHGTAYRNGWHFARMTADRAGEGFEHAGVNVPGPFPPVVTPPPPPEPLKQAAIDAPEVAGWQGIKGGTSHLFQPGSKKSVCRKVGRTTGPTHDEPPGIACSLCLAKQPPKPTGDQLSFL